MKVGLCLVLLAACRHLCASEGYSLPYEKMTLDEVVTQVLETKAKFTKNWTVLETRAFLLDRFPLETPRARLMEVLHRIQQKHRYATFIQRHLDEKKLGIIIYHFVRGADESLWRSSIEITFEFDEHRMLKDVRWWFAFIQ